MPETENGKKRASGKKSVRIEVSIPFPLLSQFDDEAERRGYNRSEALRAAMRDQLERWTGRRL
jgi:metal-responsive CopG/Arc/MetJ family transcriptional regulator